MNDGLKQRLVGAVVLLAIGVVFLPALFTPEHRRQIDRTTQIPPAPLIQTTMIEAPKPVLGVEAPKPAAEAYQLLPEDADDDPAVTVEIKSDAAVAESAKPALSTKQLVPQAWVVQVGSFTQESRALEMRDTLIDQSMPSFIRTHKSSNGVTTRVFVGPKISIDAANTLKRKLDKTYNVESLVVAFEP